MLRLLATQMIPILLTTLLISVLGLFITVNGHDIRIVAVEGAQEKELRLVTEINQKQDHMIYTLCLLVNNKELSKCSNLTLEGRRNENFRIVLTEETRNRSSILSGR